jgi:hypothetical protein
MSYTGQVLNTGFCLQVYTIATKTETLQQHLTYRGWTKMPVLPLKGLSFCGLAWTYKLLPTKHTGMSIGHARPVVITF